MNANGAAPPAEATQPAPAAEGSYRMLLPPLPTGEHVANTVFLHCDPNARPYRIDDFQEVLKNAGGKENVTAIGAFRYNHVWLLTLKSVEAKEAISSQGKITIKGRTCVVIDPNRIEKEIRVHWLPPFIPDEEVAKAFASFGEVKSVVREKWRKPGYEDFESTTRTLHLLLHERVSVNAIPQQLCILGVDVLVSVPGRPPTCLRCGQVGHMRRQCETPWCARCRGFGHSADACVPTYASMTRVTGAVARNTSELGAVMDEIEMSETGPSRQLPPKKGPRRELEVDTATTPAEISCTVPGTLTSSSVETGTLDGRSMDEEHQKTEKPVSGEASGAEGTGDLDGDDRDEDAEVGGLPPWRRQGRLRRTRSPDVPRLPPPTPAFTGLSGRP